MANTATVVEKVSGETREVSTSDPIFLDEASTITLQVDPNDVATITRAGVDGQDLIVVLDDGTQIVIQNYFAANSGGELSELVLVDEQGGSWWLRADPETGGFLLVGDTTIPVASAVVASSADAAAFSPILGIGLGAGAIALGLASMGGGSSGSPSTPLPPSPPPPADVTPPPPPTAVINATGDTVSGTAEPGSTVNVYDADGNIIGTGVAGADGQYSITLDPPLIAGEALTVTATDAAGNESDPVALTAPDLTDTTAPESPTAVINATGDTVSGTAEPGATVNVYDADGNIIGTGVAGADGQYSITLDPPLTAGEALTVTATDAAGNESDPVALTAPDLTDTTAPEPPTAVINATGDTVSGTAEAGATVNVYDADGNVIGTGVADTNGRYSITLAPPLTAGEALTVTATDAAGNESDPVALTAPDLTDTTAPEPPTAVINATGDTVSGTTEAGATVNVYDADGNVIGTGVADTNGRYSITLDPALTAGEALTVTATDAAGNESDPVALTAPDLTDTTAPEPPTAVINATGDTVSGTAEAGATVNVYDADGNVIGTGVADTNGRYSITLDPALTAGEALTVTATDAAGNESDPVALTAPDLTDTTAPEPPTAVINETGDTVSGTAEAGATVNVYDADGNVIGTSVADTNGRYSITLDPALTAGEALTVTATDAAGNESDPVALTAPDLTDTTAPEPPTAVISATGDTVSGTAEAGATVNVYDADGNVIGTGVADTNGRYSITLDPALTAGESLTVTATDAAGNESDPVALTAPDLTDTTAPEPPTAVINATGDTVSGTAEAGATVNVYDADGNVIGTGVADTNGRYSITLDPPLTAGEALTVTAADAAGNESDPVALTAPDLTDTTAPEPPTAVINATGDTVSGTAEVGATVNVYDADGNIIGTGVANTEGRYSITLDPALTAGEALTVSATDAAGNESDPVALTAPDLTDTTAPEPPTAVINATGDTVSGTAEVGATVNVYDADGNVIGTGVANTEGRYSITLDPALTAGEALTVSATDAAGNESDPVALTAPDLTDSTAPEAPTAAISAAGDSIDGLAEPGSTITVRNSDNVVIGTGIAGTNGRYSIALDPALVNGEVVTVTATDAADNESEPTLATAPDLDNDAIPDSPTAAVSAAGDAVTGIAEAGATVIVRDADGNELGRVTADADTGAYSFPLDPPLIAGQQLSVSAANVNGESFPTTIFAPDLSDTEAPLPPTAVINDAGDTVTGIAEPGSTVEVRDAGGAVLGSGAAGTDGRYTVTLDPPLTGGETLDVLAIDGAGNESDPTSLTAPDLSDTEAPPSPTAVINDAGDTVTGIAEPGSTVEVRDADGTVLGSGAAGTDGRYTVTLDPPLTSGETLDVVAIDGTGNESDPTSLTAPDLSDTEAPPSPTAVINDAGDTVTGIAEPGSTVEVRDADGTVLGSGPAGTDGRYTITLDPPLTGGETLYVVAIDGAGNESDPTSLTAPDLSDTEAPPSPTAVINDAGDTVTGIAEPGSTVEVRDADGAVLGSGPAGTDGRYTITLNPPLTGGETLDVLAIDGAGNESDPTSLTAPDLSDTEAPPSPTAVINDAGDTVTGIAEPGSTVEVRDADGTVLGSGAAGTDGRYTVTLDPPLTSGETLDVVAIDGAGNESYPTSLTAPDLSDTEAPLPPTAVINDAGDTVTGIAEPGSTVEVRDENGAVLGSGAAGTDGRYSVTLDPPLTSGETLDVVAIDGAGNESDPTSLTAPDLSDTEAPPSPTAVINDAGDTVTGIAEPGTRVEVRDADGDVLGFDNAGTDGRYTITLDPPLTSGETLDVVAIDGAGNESDPTSLTAPDLSDTEAPPSPTAVINDAGDTVTGIAEPGTRVEVRDADGTVLGFDEAGIDGRYTIPLDPPLTAGEALDVVAIDGAGNESEPTTLTAPDLSDTEAPLPPTAFITAGGDVITGSTEAGATVEIRDADGTVIGSAVAGTDGRYVFMLDPPRTEGEVLTINAVDAAGNRSGDTTVTAPDLTDNEAPEPPTAAINATGDVVTGLAEVGATITVYGAGGVILGTGTAGTNGRYEVEISPVQVEGQTLEVTAADAAGNESAPTTVVAPIEGDEVSPEPPTATINATGDTVTGLAEAGSTVRVFDVDGNELNSAIAAPDGSYTIGLDPALTEGQQLSVTATDADGNESFPTTIFAPDLTDTDAPDAPTAFIDGAGSVVTGLAEPGAIVEIRNADDVVIGFATAATDGRYTIGLDPALTAGETIAVTARDAAGNVSEPTVVIAPDLTDAQPPDAPTAVISAAGDTVSGTTEAGARVDVLDAAGNVVGSAVANGDGRYTAALVPPQTSGQTLEVTATDAAGNTSDPTTITAPVLDSEAPDAPDAVISPDGATVSGTAEPGSIVRVFDANEVELGFVEVGPGGEFSIPLTPPRIAGETLTVTATDDAGNVSEPTELTAPVVDTEAPPPPVADINAAGDTVSGTAEALSLVRVRNAAGTVIGTGVADSDGAFSITLTPALIDSEALTVTAQDAAGNESAGTPLTAPDLTAPDAPTAEVNETGTLVTGTAEVGSLVTVFDEDGNALGSVEAIDGTYSIELDPALTGGERLLVTATDDAGNVSPATAINAPSPPDSIIAYDNIATVDLDIVPTTTPVALGSAGYLALVSVNALNLQANVNVLGTPSVEFTVDPGHSLAAVFDYAALATIGVLGNYQVVVQRWDGTAWTGVGGTGQATLLELALLGGTTSAQAELGPGEYRAFMTFNGVGVGVLGSLAVRGVESDFTDIESVDGAPISGNVITDDGGDVVTPATVVQSVNGVAVGAGGTAISGDYGVLTINPDGSYTYVPTENAENIGQVDAFEYVISSGTSTATATLYVRIDSNDVALTWSDSDPGAPATFDFAASDDAAVAGVEFANATGDVFNANAGITLGLFNTNQTFTSGTFTVTDTMDVFGTASISSVVALLGSGGLALQQQTATGGWVNVVRVPYSVLIGVAAPLATIDLATLDLGPGTYRFSATVSGAVGLQVNVAVDVNATFTDQFVFEGSDSASGNLLANDTLGSSFSVLQISDGAGGWIDIPSGAPTTIQGDHGSLSIDASGNYVYTPTDGTGYFTAPLVDEFGYRLLHPTGRDSEGALVVTVEATGAGAQVSAEAFDLDAMVMDEAANDADGGADASGDVDVDVARMFASAGQEMPLMVRGEGDAVIALDAPGGHGAADAAAWNVDYAVPMRHEDDTDALLQQQPMSAV